MPSWPFLWILRWYAANYLIYLWQAGTYIKEFVHGDLGRTHPRYGNTYLNHSFSSHKYRNHVRITLKWLDLGYALSFDSQTSLIHLFYLNLKLLNHFIQDVRLLLLQYSFCESFFYYYYLRIYPVWPILHICPPLE